jgi:hypothetical protein
MEGLERPAIEPCSCAWSILRISCFVLDAYLLNGGVVFPVTYRYVFQVVRLSPRQGLLERQSHMVSTMRRRGTGCKGSFNRESLAGPYCQISSPAHHISKRHAVIRGSTSLQGRSNSTMIGSWALFKSALVLTDIKALAGFSRIFLKKLTMAFIP